MKKELEKTKVPETNPFPKQFSDGKHVFVFNKLYRKFNGVASAYYKCTNCKKSVVTNHSQGITYLVKNHDCNIILSNIETAQLQIIKYKMLEEAEKLFINDKNISSLECYRRVIKYDLVGYDIRLKALSLKEIENLKNQINAKKNTRDAYLPESAQVFQLNGENINFLSYHILHPLHIIIFSCDDQKAFFSRAKKIFIDGTFRETPKDFADGQLLNIIILHEETNVYIPVSHILMKQRTYEAYCFVFSMLKIDGNWPNAEIVLTDFEDALQNSCKQAFNVEKTTGCYFHYTKAIRTKIEGLYYPNTSRTLLFTLFKELPFISSINQGVIIKKLGELNSEELNCFLEYYCTQWLNNESLEYSDDIKTNNACESFHSELSRSFPNDHPTVEALTKRLWDLFIIKRTKVEELTKNPTKIQSQQNYIPKETNEIISIAGELYDQIKIENLILRDARKVPKFNFEHLGDSNMQVLIELYNKNDNK